MSLESPSDDDLVIPPRPPLPGSAQAPFESLFQPTGPAPTVPPSKTLPDGYASGWTGSAAVILPPREPNKLGLIALVAAGVGLVLACIPPILIAGWVVLPIALALGIVAITRPRKDRLLAMLAIGVAVLGMIVGMIVFLASSLATLSSAVDQYRPTGSSSGAPVETATPSPTRTPTPSPTSTGIDIATVTALGVGDELLWDDWIIVVDEIDQDAAEEVAEPELFNDPAPFGTHYVVLRVTATYTGEGSATSAATSFSIVTENDEEIRAYDSSAALDDDFGFERLDSGERTDGTVVYEVPDEEDFVVKVAPNADETAQYVRP